MVNETTQARKIKGMDNLCPGEPIPDDPLQIQWIVQVFQGSRLEEKKEKLKFVLTFGHN